MSAPTIAETIDRLTDAELEELAAMDAAAFCAPWTYEQWEIDCEACESEHGVVLSPEEYPADPDSPQVVAQMEDCETGRTISVPGLRQFADANGELIVAMRNALPKLIAEIRAARGQR